jgi:uncharacterized protein (DUF4213/DUF364 family)
MKCPESLKWVGAAAGIAAIWAFISMYPDLKRYIKLERM